ncbi:MAG: 3-deoxy-manno-octulosonate cytidylyltransferase [Acidobacteria bacterium]|nr:MAG: 3-deoxy-manno-octulosonate cytidylyltransferase [Acidobacteriota bacterium]
MPQAVVVIPARWASKRFPGKVLAPLAGRPLVLHACGIASRARTVRRVIVATDDDRVRHAVEEAGFEAAMTAPDHPSGTDRVAEVARGLEEAIVIGLQADEPFLEPGDLDALASAVAAPGGPRLATLAAPLRGREAWLDPNAVKVAAAADGRALYFSRAPIPYVRRGGLLEQPPAGGPPACARLHVGVYAWRREALLEFAGLPPSPLEKAEGLEQLRALEAGWRVLVLPASGRPMGVDTPEDLERAEREFGRTTGTGPR